tara:strand:+ start:213 stop:1007 length:795 start_codon:yes stop_codon:yes gene_type:complete
MDMNQFRNYLSDRSKEGLNNRPNQDSFGDVLAAVNDRSKANLGDTLEEQGDVRPLPGPNRRAQLAKLRKVAKDHGPAFPSLLQKNKKPADKPADKPKKVEPAEEFSLTGREILESFAVVDAFNENIAEGIEDGEDLLDVIEECVELLDENDEDEKFVLEAYSIVDNFYESVMNSCELNEGSEDLHSLVERVLENIELDEVYGAKLPVPSQGMSDEEKKKVQKGEASKMPKAGVEDELPGEKQSSIDAVKAVLGGKKSSAADSAY